MKYLIASDFHGNLSAYEKLRLTADGEKPDKIILLGDLTDGYGAESVNNELRKIFYPIISVRGNCDYGSSYDKLELGDQGRYFTEELCGRKLFFTHGHLYGMTLPPTLGENDVIFFGHYHVPEISKANGVWRVCVGSLGMPKLYASPSYCIFIDNKIKLVNSIDGKTIVEVNI